MKKLLIIVVIILSIPFTQAQESTDAVRYAQTNLTGTARFRAMSGAFGALGGDLSSITVNPAGSAVFLNNQLGFTLSNFDTNNESTYFGTQNTNKNNDFKLNQVGAVFVFHNDSPSENWKKLAFSINYENTNNFDNFITTAGTNPTNSVGNYFLSYANFSNYGAPVPQEFVNRTPGESTSSLYTYLSNNLPSEKYPYLSGFEAQQAMIANQGQGYIIKAIDNNDPNSKFESNVTKGGNYQQKNTSMTTGYNGKVSFNAASSYKNKLYLGLNLNTHFVDYRQSTSFTEKNNNTLSKDYTVTQIQFNNDMYSYGSGFSFQLGIIAKPINIIRLGLAYESPTWYEIYDKLTQKLSAISSNNIGSLNPDVVSPKEISYEPYKLQTPSKLTGSIAFVLAKKGLISVDYTIKDYRNTKFKPLNDSYFIDLNAYLADILAFTSELRIGGEYKIDAVSLRAGYRYEQSPYQDQSIMGNLTGYSGGIGYNFGSTKLDVSYATAKRDSQQQFFSNGFTDAATIRNQSSTITATLLFEL